MNATAQKSTTKRNHKEANPNNGEDKFISKILENLDKVNSQDWENYTNYKFQTPKNLFSKNSYKGFNLFALYIDTLTNGFTSSLYATFNSIAKAGGLLKKGSKGVVIEFFSYVYKHKATGKNYSLEQIQNMSPKQLEDISKFPVIKNYFVFNACQIENLEDLDLNIDFDEVEELEFLEQENCEILIENIVINGGLKLEFKAQKYGSYFPGLDRIIMPLKKDFISEQKFYTTIFHEIIHWTGHEKRLNRNLVGGVNDREQYSFEELIAEMGSMLLALQFGITEQLLNSIRYLKGWSEKNKENRIENIKSAFIQSKKAKKFLEKI